MKGALTRGAQLILPFSLVPHPQGSVVLFRGVSIEFRVRNHWNSDINYIEQVARSPSTFRSPDAQERLRDRTRGTLQERTYDMFTRNTQYDIFSSTANEGRSVSLEGVHNSVSVITAQLTAAI